MDADLRQRRFGGLLLPDIKTICANLDFGERLLKETIEPLRARGRPGSMRYACDVVGRDDARGGRELLPDGVYEAEDMFDADGIDDSEGGYVIKVKITKRGHRVEVDLSGSSRQAPTTINAALAGRQDRGRRGVQDALRPALAVHQRGVP